MALQIYNDDVLDKLIDLQESECRIYIQPCNATNFWRLGIRLGTTFNIDFFHPSARYEKKPEHDKYIDINIGVGEWDGSEWSLPHRIHLAQYNLIVDPAKHILHRSDEYVSAEEIEWDLSYAIRFKRLGLTYYFGNQKFSNSYTIDESYRYFKIFAWSDSKYLQHKYPN